MQNKDDKEHNSMRRSVDQSNEMRNNSSKHSPQERERSRDRDQDNQSPLRRDYDKDRGASKPDEQPHHPQGEHSGHEPSQPES